MIHIHVIARIVTVIHTPVIAGIVTGIALPLIMFAIEAGFEWKNMRRNKTAETRKKLWWTLTPQKKVRDFNTGEVRATDEEVDFDPRHGHYMRCGEIIITLASASLVFLPSLHFTAALPWLGLPMVLFGFTVAYTLTFMGLLTYFYEMQLHNPDTFTALRSCLLFSLGFSSLACFAIAYFVFSLLIGTALSQGYVISAGH